MATSTGDLNHFRWVNYRANVYSICATRRRSPEILKNRARAGCGQPSGRACRRGCGRLSEPGPDAGAGAGAVDGCRRRGLTRRGSGRGLASARVRSNCSSCEETRMALDEDVVRLAKGKNLATVVTLMPDGQPQALLTWIDTDGEHVLVNTEPQRQKARNVARDPRVTVLIRSDNFYDWAEIQIGRG